MTEVKDPSAAPDELDRLASDGFFLRTDWLSARVADAARSAVQGLAGFSPAGIGRGGDRHLERTVRNDERVWIDPAQSPEGLLPVLTALEQLRLWLNREAQLGLQRTELQLARFGPDGTLYQRHKDSFRGSQGRRVTALYYLNPDWQPEHGGALRLHLEGRAALDVPPELNTLVVFLSERVEHEVLPNFAPRYALTVWWSGAQVFGRREG
ncbi:MAG: 2OG-Fe(II) oxygenase [Myxococcota bacterium]|nr:2OG-Fe(II) oxygenase [Myxococcota bacterium]